MCVGLDDAATVLRRPGGALATRTLHRDEDGLLGVVGAEAGEVGVCAEEERGGVSLDRGKEGRV